jgi:bifunctional UDP-N-acetylglucosamine pyrophosphorylase/glucosamine-1-phosphate N-acetyltransferase
VSSPTVLILAAGQGTRMRSHTPKVLHELCGRPLILWPVLAAREAGAGRVVVVDSPQRALQAVLPDGVELAVQPQPDGTGGAVAAALEHMRREAAAGGDTPATVLVLSGDVPLITADVIAGLARAHEGSGAAATMLTAVLDDPTGYGRVMRDGDGCVERVVETKTDGDAGEGELAIHEVNAGVYAFARAALEQALPALASNNAQGELYLPQVLEVMRREGLAVAAQLVGDASLLLGVNDRVELSRARAIAQLRIHEGHLRAGVQIVDPATTVIDADVQIGIDTVVEPFTTIRGTAEIGAGATIRHSYLVDCTVEDGASVGPFAYLRPGATLRAGAKVGTFVEVKNSDIGPGAKVPHLSYIGDAEVGERSNLGAGSITANYDGRAKHRTKIGKRVQGGVNTSYVAPVTVGDDTYTAAGSVITEEVPPGALAIARAKQRNVAEYARRASAERQEGGLHSEER